MGEAEGRNAKRYGISYVGGENVLKLTVLMVIQLSEYTKNPISTL